MMTEKSTTRWMGWISHRNGVDNPCMSSLAKSERRFCRNISCRLRKLLPKDIDNRPTENSLLSVKYTRIIPRPIFFRDGLKKKKNFYSSQPLRGFKDDSALWKTRIQWKSDFETERFPGFSISSVHEVSVEYGGSYEDDAPAVGFLPGSHRRPTVTIRAQQPRCNYRTGHLMPRTVNSIKTRRNPWQVYRIIMLLNGTRAVNLCKAPHNPFRMDYTNTMRPYASLTQHSDKKTRPECIIKNFGQLREFLYHLK